VRSKVKVVPVSSGAWDPMSRGMVRCYEEKLLRQRERVVRVTGDDFDEVWSPSSIT